MKLHAYLRNREIPGGSGNDEETESGGLPGSDTTVFSDDQSSSGSGSGSGSAAHHSRTASDGSYEEEDEEQGAGKRSVGAYYRCVATIHGHAGWVSCVALSGDEDREFLLSASQGRDIRAWQHPDLRHRATFGARGGGGAVKALVALGHDKLLTGHQDRRIRVWRRAAGPRGKYRLLTAVPTRRDYVSNMIVQRRYVQTRRHHRRLWIEHADTVSCLAAGNGLLYSGSWDATLKVWSLRDFRCLQSIAAHRDAVNAVAVDARGVVYSASADCRVRVWSNDRGRHELVATLEGHESSVNALAVAGDGRLVYSGGSDRRIVAWEASTLERAGTLRGHRLAVLCLCAAGELLCSGSADMTVRLWRRDDEGAGRCAHSAVAVLRGHDAPVKCVAAAAGVAAGFMVYSGSLDRSIRVWWVSGRAKTQALLPGIRDS